MTYLFKFFLYINVESGDCVDKNLLFEFGVRSRSFRNSQR